MVPRHVAPAMFAALLLTATGATAEYSGPINDHAVDPMTAAIRTVLARDGQRSDFLSKDDAAAVVAYYESRGFEPVWTEDGALNERGRAVASRLRDAHTDGLDPSVYPTPADSDFLGYRDTAQADVLLTGSLLTYARHAYGGRIRPADISKNLDYKPNRLDPLAVLSEVVLADDPAMQLASYNPDRPEFQALRERLAEERASSRERPPYIEPGRYLKLGTRSPRVALLRERLGIEPPAPQPVVETATETAAAAEGADGVDVPAEDAVEEVVAFDPELFDEVVDEAVRAFQEQAGLTVDGIVGPGTLGVLNAAAEDHEATIIANMERWRWMPKELGEFYVRVNVPNFNLEIYRDERIVHTTRIVVGKPVNQTPVFSDEIEHVIVNPTWHVPASITRNELVPAVLKSGGGALRGYNVYANVNGRFRQVNPVFVNWSSVDLSKIQIKQPPGARNALGQVKFMFPNRHSVYLHDTPAKSLFQKDYRAYSHGCMRVHQPWEFAQALLDYDPDLSADAVQSRIGGREQQMNLARHIPVHVTYFTAWIDSYGELQIRNDLYGHDRRMLQALGLS